MTFSAAVMVAILFMAATAMISFTVAAATISLKAERAMTIWMAPMETIPIYLVEAME